MGEAPVSREEYDEFIAECSRNIPEGFSRDDEPAEAVIVRYIRHLEGRPASVRQTIGVVEAGSKVIGMVIS